MNKLIPNATLKRMLRLAGAERVSEEATNELKNILEGVGKDLAEQAVRYAKHSGRQTILAKDIQAALETI